MSFEGQPRRKVIAVTAVGDGVEPTPFYWSCFQLITKTQIDLKAVIHPPVVSQEECSSPVSEVANHISERDLVFAGSSPKEVLDGGASKIVGELKVTP